MKEKITAVVVGGSGFTGMELIKILNLHKYTEVKIVTSRKYKDVRVSEAFSSYTDYTSDVLIFKEEVSKDELKDIDVVFLCHPTLKSMQYLKENLLNYDGVIIDIGSDFRINDPDNFNMWYGSEHILKGMLPDFVYGITEINKQKIKNCKHIANPGCYPTSVILSLAPVLASSNFDIESINVDAKSGVSGAGRKLKMDYLFCNVDNNFFAYAAEAHRHIGEIEQEVSKIAKKEMKVCFTPHLLPINRGIFTSIYCKLEHKDNLADEVEKAYKAYDEFYKDSFFVQFQGKKIPQLKDVIGTNICQIGICFDKRTDTLKIFSAIDNLLKGAAGQAVQNMNIAFGFDEREGLIFNGLFS
jgi:N-acetyl-gamma-glutamyl-phosphate reductase